MVTATEEKTSGKKRRRSSSRAGDVLEGKTASKDEEVELKRRKIEKDDEVRKADSKQKKDKEEERGREKKDREKKDKKDKKKKDKKKKDKRDKKDKDKRDKKDKKEPSGGEEGYIAANGEEDTDVTMGEAQESAAHERVLNEQRTAGESEREEEKRENGKEQRRRGKGKGKDDSNLPLWMRKGHILSEWDPVPISDMEEWMSPTVAHAVARHIVKQKSSDELSDREVEELCPSALLFPVQAAVLPVMTKGARHACMGGISGVELGGREFSAARDVLVCAPTGSGKTLAFAIPIINALLERRVAKSRALILLPSKDLATQVFDVFESVMKELECVRAKERQRMRKGECDEEGKGQKEMKRKKKKDKKRKKDNSGDSLSNDQENGKGGVERDSSAIWESGDEALPLRIALCLGEQSFEAEAVHLKFPYAADIVVATPGRLMDHLNCGNLHLLDLRFLVIDEADRLMKQSYQDWVLRVLSATREAVATVIPEPFAPFYLPGDSASVEECQARILDSRTGGNTAYALSDADLDGMTAEQWWRVIGGEDDSVSRHNVSRTHIVRLSTRPSTAEKNQSSGERNKGLGEDGLDLLESYLPSRGPLRKYLFSATLTRNPTKLAALQLERPVYFHTAASGRFTLPPQLREFMLVCEEAAEKPLLLARLLRAASISSAICFTKSVEATHRLYLLLSFLGFEGIAEFSSNLSQAMRRQVIDDFRAGSLNLIICSDVMARGLDIHEIRTVINYDVPPFVNTYVHRVGRTARAGQEGSCYSLLRKEEVRHFKEMRRKAENPQQLQNYPKLSVREEEEFSEELFEESLGKLQLALLAEQQHKRAKLNASNAH